MFVFAVVLATLMLCLFTLDWKTMLWQGKLFGCRLICSFQIVIVHSRKDVIFLYPFIVCLLYVFISPSIHPYFHCFLHPTPILVLWILFSFLSCVLVTFSFYFVLPNRKDVSDCLLGKCFYLLDVHGRLLNTHGPVVIHDSAFQDTRFAPISARELSHLTCG